MEVKTLYKYKENGKTVVSPNKPAGDCSTTYRVVAQEGAEITNGNYVATVIDTDNPNDWSEIESAEAEEILNILTGGDV